MFRIGGNTFYGQKNKIPLKIPEFKRSVIGIITEFCGIPSGFLNQVLGCEIDGSARSDAGNLFQRGWPRLLWLGDMVSSCAVQYSTVEDQKLFL